MTEQPLQLKFSRFWCAEYPDGDKIGEVLANVALLPYFVILHSASRCYSRRDVHDMLVLAGLVANEALAKGLKQLLQHPRPLERCELLGTCDSHGMPSSHTQCMAFAAALQAVLLSRHIRKMALQTAAIGLLEVACMAAATAAVAYSRVYLQYHSLDQVLIGAATGALFAVAWSTVMAAAAPVYAAVAESCIGRLLHVKDSWHVAEPLWLEREVMAAAAAKRRRKGLKPVSASTDVTGSKAKVK